MKMPIHTPVHDVIMISKDDIAEVAANIILATSQIIRDIANSDNTIESFKSTFEHYLPKDLANTIDKLLTQEAINQCDRLLKP